MMPKFKFETAFSVNLAKETSMNVNIKIQKILFPILGVNLIMKNGYLSD